jgi:hypothetical protein
MLLIVLLLSCTQAHALTPEELRALIGQGEAAQRERALRYTDDDLSNVLPHKPESAPAPPPVDNTVNKYSVSGGAKPDAKTSDNTGTATAGTPSAATPKPTRTRALPPGVYLPPTVTTGRTDADFSNSVVLANPQLKFGIKKGTWMDAELQRSVTNADPGLVSLILTTDVVGKYRTLPAGTELFAEKSYNRANERMDLTTVSAVLPDHRELAVIAQIFDLSENSGLAVVVLKEGVVDTSVKQGLIAGGAAVLSKFAGESPVEEALKTTSDSLLSYGETQIKPVYTDLVSTGAQPVKLWVTESF